MPMIAPGTLLGTNRIVRPLASGGMGDVYVAEDTRLERRIALKVLPADMATNPERLERFEREAKVVASLNHPNIVTIHSVEEATGPDGNAVHFITMELVDGQTLDREIPHGGLTIDRFFAIAVPLADAVGAAHNQGITHRDLKPGNVMFTADGRLKVLDFGLAKLARDDVPRDVTDPTAATAATLAAAPITEEGKVLGTVAYMSPEQAEGKPVDKRSDIFSLGIMLYELATGTLPFSGDTKMSLMSSIIKDTPVPVTEIKRELPNHLGRIIRHCLEKDPDRRFQSSQDVRNELAGLKEEIDSGELVVSQSSIDPAQPPATTQGPQAMDSLPSDPEQAPAQASASPSGEVIAPPGTPAPAAPADTAPTDVSAPAQAVESDLRGQPTAPASAPGSTEPRGLLHSKAVLGTIGAVAVVAALGYWMWGGGEQTGAISVSGDDDAGGVAAETIADTRPSVAVLYFDNLSGDDSLDWLRSGLTELLVTDLSQSPELRVITSDALYEILDETGNLEARVTSAAVVREVAERAEVDHVVVGSFIRAGDTFRLSARLQEAATGEVLAAETVEGPGEDSVFASVDTLTRRIKDRLSVPVSTAAVVDRDLSDVTTSSMDAYRHYTDGVNLISQSRYVEAVQVFERALEIDPEFAMAFAKLSIAYRNLFDFDTARVYAARAIEHADRLTQRERFYIEGRYYAQDSETSLQSIEAYENALALYPDDSASRNNVALEYAELERHGESVAHFEELLRRGSPFLPSYFNAAMAYVHNGECERGYELIRDFVRRQPDYHFGYSDLAEVALFCGRLDEADAALSTYEESIEAGAPGDVLDGIVRFRLHILTGELDLAMAANEQLRESTSPVAQFLAYPGNRRTVAAYRGLYSDELQASIELLESVPDEASEKATLITTLAYWLLDTGEVDRALALADSAGGLTQNLDNQIGAAALTAIAHARAGRAVAARTAAQQHQRLSAQVPHPWARRLEHMVAAEIALSQDDIDGALDRLQQAHELLPPGPTFPPFDEFVLYTFALAEAQYAAGNKVEAVELFRAVTESGTQRINQPLGFVRSFYWLGKIAEEDGDGATARANYERFLEYWGDGELDRDKVAEARAFVSAN